MRLQLLVGLLLIACFVGNYVLMGRQGRHDRMADGLMEALNNFIRHNDTDGEGPNDTEKMNDGRYHATKVFNTAFSNSSCAVSSVQLPELSESKPIAYRIMPHGRYETNLEAWYSCPSGPSPDDRSPLPHDNPFNFNTIIHTNLNIVFMGDSVAVEFGKWFQIACQANRLDELYQIKWKKNQPGYGLAASPVSGGGIVAFWRLLGLWEDRHRGRPLPNKGYGWRMNWRKMLYGHAKQQSGARADYQIVIFRVNHPWVCPEEVTIATLNETVNVAKSVFGQQIKMLLLTAPINNNVYIDNMTIPSGTRCSSTCGLAEFEAMNERICEFVSTRNASDVLLSDVHAYMNHVILWNAAQIGMSTTTISNPNSLMQHLLPLDENQNYWQQVVQVCAEKVPVGSTNCRRNVLSHDGMHLCMETLGPRMFANWACLIQCTYRDKDQVRVCERGCNDEFFTLKDA